MTLSACVVLMTGYVVAGSALQKLTPSPQDSERRSLLPAALAESSHSRSFSVASRVAPGDAQTLLLIDLDRKRSGNYVVAASAMLLDDQGEIGVPEMRTNRIAFPPSQSAQKFAFQVPPLPDGYYRGEVYVGWHNDGIDSDTAIHDIYLRVRNGKTTSEDAESWHKNSRVMQPRKTDD